MSQKPADEKQGADGADTTAHADAGPVLPMKKRRVPCSQMDMSQRLDYACESVGYQKTNMHQYTSIDFCLDEIGKIDWVCHFTGLKELTIANNSVTEIEGIDKCKFLEKVWLSNNLIEHIRCFESLTSVKWLFLSFNKIKRIRGLELLSNLQRLWLDGNVIEQLDGLQELTTLTELNLACNNIESIGVYLDTIQNLKDLNLAGNKIGSFKEVLNLNRLALLEACNFHDQNYGDNPICHLCNYTTYVLFHLPHLQRLDMKHITDDEKQFSESTFMKKRMYYNMRIKTIQRNTTNLVGVLKVCKKLRIKKLEILTERLTRKLQEVEREMDERDHLPRENIDQFESICTYGLDHQKTNPIDAIDLDELKSDIEQKKSFILSRLKQREDDLKQLEHLYETTKEKIYDISEQNINRLITELDTGGNIRFEEGRPQDKWYTSCVDLVKSRFHPEQMSSLGVCGISVNRITRIHNRFLRNRFEDKLDLLVDMTDTSYKRYLEYLFYGTNPKYPREMHKTMEEGFRTNQEYVDAGLPACVSLVNSVASAEIPRINHALNKLEKHSRSQLSEERAPIPSGQILVCKIFLQKCVHDTRTPYFKNDLTPQEIWRQAPLDPRSFQGIQSVYRVKENDAKQRMWVVMDHGLALPEYLVDFDFCQSQAQAEESKRLGTVTTLNEECNSLFQGVIKCQGLLESKFQQVMQAQVVKSPDDVVQRTLTVPLTATDLDRSDMACVKKMLHSFMTFCHVRELMENNFQFVQEDKSGANELENVMPPEIPLRSQFNQITEHLITNLSRQPDFTCITYLNLFNNCIRKIQALDQLVNLQTLILSFNQIDSIQGLSTNSNLVRLDLNHNFIRVVENLETQSTLESLDLRHNWIQDFGEVERLQKFCPKLQRLALKANPIAQGRTYRSRVFKFWNPQMVKDDEKGLRKLDGGSMKERDRQALAASYKKLTPDIIDLAVKQQKKAHLLMQQNDFGKMELRPEWQRSVEMLDLSHQRVQEISGLELFTGLRKLILLNNKISHISGLDTLKSLEELNLEKNKLQAIQNLENLRNLKKLDLGSNQIRRIQNLSQLTNLTQLSLENNKITRLDGLEELTSLMELYVDNNLIQDVQEVLKLKDLPRLIILDCSCNPIASQNASNGQNYRIFCIFSLRKLRVLDGISIDPQEHQEAKETFSGRLTDEMLGLRLNGRKSTDVRDLDLSNCKLKDFEDTFDHSKLPAIRELNLNGNNMQSLKAIGYLPTLKILRLKGNKIDTLFVKPAGGDEKNFKRGLFGVLGVEFLDVSQNQLQYLFGLQNQNLKDLKVLLVAENQISKIEHLDKLKQLREIDLSKNKIRQLEARSFHTPHSQLLSLRLDDNPIKTIQHIEYLEKLQVLQMQGTRLAEFMELERISELPNLIELLLLHTPLSRKPQYRLAVLKRLPQLEVLDNKDIPAEEKRRIEMASGGVIIPPNQQIPNVHFQQYPPQPTQQQPLQKPTVKVSNMNFEGLHTTQQTPHSGQPKQLQEYSLQIQGQVPLIQHDQLADNNSNNNVRQSGKRPSTKAVNDASSSNNMLRSQQNKYLDGKSVQDQSLYQPSQFQQPAGPTPQGYLQGLHMQQQFLMQQQQQSTQAAQNAAQPKGGQARSRQGLNQQPSAQLQPPMLQMQIQSLGGQQTHQRPPQGPGKR